MSRGPGWVEQKVEAVFKANGDNAFTTDDLCRRVYRPRSRKALPIEKKHRVAVIRAAKRVAERMGWTWLMSWGRGGTLVFADACNVMSYAMGREKCSNYFGVTYSDDKLRARLALGGRDHHFIIEGGAWWIHTQMAIADRNGDAARAALLQAELDKGLAAIAESLNQL
jgi:hypothetical protein